jgi:hypothetical protein
MDEVTAGTPKATQGSPTVAFPVEKVVQPCSWNECSQGHRWAPVLALAQCTGCRVPIIAVQKVNCPVCNEPVVRTSLRSDFVPRGSGVSKRCEGAKPGGESVDVLLERTEWLTTTKEPVVSFEDRRKEERKDGKKG